MKTYTPLKISSDLPQEEEDVFTLGTDPEPREDYSYEPMHDWTISLAKKNFTPKQAIARFIEVVRLRNLKAVGYPFETGLHYCLRVRGGQ